MTSLIPPDGGSPRARIDRLVWLARSALVWEIAWQGLAAILTMAALFVALAWFGLFQDRPAGWKIAALAACAAAGLALAVTPVIRKGWRSISPTRQAALSRIDRDSGFRHGEASAAEDSLANDAAGPATAALWKLHQTRMAAAMNAAKVAAPSPRLADVDRFALRAGAVVLLAAAAVVAGDERGARLASAFDWGVRPAAVAAARVDAWIDPPPYTGKPPIILTGGAGTVPDAKSDKTHIAPVNSTIVVRGSNPSSLSVETSGSIAPQEPDKNAGKDQEKAPKPDGAKRFVLRGDGRLTIQSGSAGALAFDIASIPDRPPTIEMTAKPKANARGSLTLSYKTADDYGVISAEANFANPEIDGHTVSGRTLVEPPRVGLALPPDQNGLGEGQTTADLTEHAWAGARVVMTLHVRDEGGNEGASAPYPVVLPQRPFTKPLARALVEQRRNLVLDPDHRGRVSAALEALMIAPDVFGTPPGVYLGLRVGARQLSEARNDADLVDVADYLWKMALQIEDGDLSGSERDLRAAQQQLREALQRGAPDEEIKKLTENLRAAMDKFLNEMAEKQAREDQQSGPQQQGNNRQRMISREDLKSMMDRMEEMARSGNLADAQRMLEQMQNILENLKTAKRSRQNSQQREMSRAMQDLDALTREQQALRDDTFRGNRNNKGSKSGKPRAGKQPPQAGNPDSDDESADDQADSQQDADEESDLRGDRGLQQRQKALRDRLAELQKRLGQMGQQGEKGLSDADQAMKDAEDALSEDDGDSAKPGQSGKAQPGKGQLKGQGQQGQGQQSKSGKGQGRGAAADAQGRALEALNQGAQNLAKQMQKGPGQGEGEGDGEGTADGEGDDTQPGQPRQAEGSRDPLGRPTSRDPLYNTRSRYDPLGTSPALRAQRVLEELRRRLGETSRPADELDYLERLLKR